MENPPKRNAIRISEYDYSRNGYYFVTICTRDKQPIFWEPVGADIIRPQKNDKQDDCDDNPVGAGITRPNPRPQTQTNDSGRLIAAPTGTPYICLSAYGEIVDRAIQNIPATYPNVFVDTYVIMPNHIHMILVISDAALPEQGKSPTNLMHVIGQMKRWVSKNAGIPIWQKSFYEHIIRNYDDYINMVKYIMYNPQKLMINPHNKKI